MLTRELKTDLWHSSNLRGQSSNSLSRVLMQSQSCKPYNDIHNCNRKQIVGHRDPKLTGKESLRSFYAVDRVDNAFFVSENFSESLIERDYLFSPSPTMLDISQ